MALTYSFESTGRRTLDKIKGKKIIDIGGANSFADGYLDAIVEIRPPQASAPNIFLGDINMPQVWDRVLEHADQYGKWDYAICTHTLEDICNPLFVCRMIEKIAKAGLIVEPSKHRELARFDGKRRGFWHHRWIFDMVDGVFTGFPKTNYIEDERFDNVHKCLPAREELIVEWEGEINMHVVNDDNLYESFAHFQQCYDALLKDN